MMKKNYFSIILKNNWVSLILIFIITVSCSESEKNKYKEIAKNHYETYKDRDDIDKFMSYYADSVVLEDMINGDRIKGRESLKKFFNWEDTNFVMLDSVALIINSQIVEDNNIVTNGYFTPFKWGTHQFEAMHFSTILTFNKYGKIIKQIDWINYPSTLVDYNKRKNSNNWIRND